MEDRSRKEGFSSGNRSEESKVFESVIK